MDRISIDGLPLPEYLVDLISQGRWKTPSDTTTLRQLVGFTNETEFDFFKVDNMVRVNKLSHLINDPNIARIYGHASSSQTGQEITDPTILDVDKAILIAMNWDEQSICLDYRSSLQRPRVVFSYWGNKPGLRWKIIADDFKSFADYLGL